MSMSTAFSVRPAEQIRPSYNGVKPPLAGVDLFNRGCMTAGRSLDGPSPLSTEEGKLFASMFLPAVLRRLHERAGGCATNQQQGGRLCVDARANGVAVIATNRLTSYQSQYLICDKGAVGVNFSIFRPDDCLVATVTPQRTARVLGLALEMFDLADQGELKLYPSQSIVGWRPGRVFSKLIAIR